MNVHSERALTIGLAAELPQLRTGPLTNMKKKSVDRRSFLRRTAAGVAGLGLAASVDAGTATASGRSDKTDAPEATLEHSELGGLGADDHLQYLTDLRGDDRYYRKEEVSTALDTKVDTSQIDQPNGVAGLDSNGKVDPGRIATLTSPKNGDSLRYRDGAIVNVSETYRRLDIEFGVVPDGVTDNTPAIQNALNALRESSGGTLVFPNGITKIMGSTALNLHGSRGAVRMLGSGGDSVVHIAGATPEQLPETVFYIINGPSLRVEGLTFIGTPGANVYDFKKAVFFCNEIDRAVFKDCNFIGLSVRASEATSLNKFCGIIVGRRTNLFVDGCLFGGCATYQCPNVGAWEWFGLTVQDSQFIDFGYFRDQTIIKTGGTINTSWIRAFMPLPANQAFHRNKIHITRSSFDEGCYNAIYLNGAQWVELNNIAINGGVEVAVLLRNITNATIKDSLIGHINTQYGVSAIDCNVVQLDNLLLTGNVKYVLVRGTTRRLISNFSNLPGGAKSETGIINGSGATVDIIT